MTTMWQRLVNSITTFNISPDPSKYKKDLLNFISSYLIREYDRMDQKPINQFDRLEEIVWTTNKAEIPCEGAIGCATFEKVYSLYNNDPKADSLIMSMELAHHAVYEYFSDLWGGRSLPPMAPLDAVSAEEYSNDLIHYAFNFGKPPLVKKHRVRYGSRPPFIMLIYNLPAIIARKDKIMKDIKSGKAPKGNESYLRGIKNSAAKEEMLEWLSHYHMQNGHKHKHLSSSRHGYRN